MTNGMSASVSQPAARDVLANGSAPQPSHQKDAAALEPSLLSNGISLPPETEAMGEAHQQQQRRRQGTSVESGDQPAADGGAGAEPTAAAMDVDQHVKQEEGARRPDHREVLAANGPHPQENAGEVKEEDAGDRYFTTPRNVSFWTLQQKKVTIVYYSAMRKDVLWFGCRHATAMSACATVEHLFKDRDYRLPVDYIDPPDELDASDSEVGHCCLLRCAARTRPPFGCAA